MVIKEEIFHEIITFEYIMWRKSYIGGEIKLLLEVLENQGKSGRARIIDVKEAKRPYLYDDYTDLHGGIDSFCKKATLEEIKSILIGKEGFFKYDERFSPPINIFKLKDQIPINLKKD
ncbi:MAG: hypothetical protein NZ922_04200 [Candidatus Methanomethyliaceae archaeon]|nr:hypothetical protein [Candidatus Methanomethyliaceae archaeon]MCX8170166.1 hypothetical protein [Candidatus Methanomethyliaceae archaeon]MDW7970609.1 hypothetical protein [Nitrososphaerota archaeon]